jgi:biopolymer transport protein TolR
MSATTYEHPISAAQRARIRRMSAARASPEGEAGGELNVVPYLDVVMNIVVFIIATLSTVHASSVETKPPALTPPAAPSAAPGPAPPFKLTVLVSSEGFSVKTERGNMAPGCAAAGPGITVPAIDGQPDYGALTRCARTLRDGAPGASKQVTISANPDVSYQTLVDTMDALRRDAEGDLFPDVLFGIVR